MTAEESRAYSKGYAAGLRRAWPCNKPPKPPDEHISNLMAALTDLRDSADSICASLMEDDEFTKILSPKIDAVDRAMADITTWLKSHLT